MDISVFRERYSRLGAKNLHYMNALRYPEDYVHLTIPVSAFKEFSEEQIEAVVLLSELWNEDHVHLIGCYKRVPKSWPNGIKAEPIWNVKHIEYIIINFMLLKDRHDLSCNVTFGVRSLRDRTAEVICSRLHNPTGDVQELPLPKILKKDMLEKGDKFFRLPDWNGEDYDKIDVKNFSSMNNIIYSPNFVAWFQYPSVQPFRSRKAHFILISFDFLTADDVVVKKCEECARGVYGKKILWKRYVRRPGDKSFMRSPANWCHLCKRVPLFRVCPGGYFLQTFNVVIQLDYFPEGIEKGKRDIWHVNLPKSRDHFVSRYREVSNWFRRAEDAAPYTLTRYLLCRRLKQM